LPGRAKFSTVNVLLPPKDSLQVGTQKNALTTTAKVQHDSVPTAPEHAVLTTEMAIRLSTVKLVTAPGARTKVPPVAATQVLA
jgi:hypothetical protein